MVSDDPGSDSLVLWRNACGVREKAGEMKRLSFFKVYGRVDPRLAERRRFTEWSDSPPEYRCEMIGPLPHFVHQSETVTQGLCLGDLMRNSYRIMRARQAAPAYEPNYLMGREQVEPFRENLISMMATAIAGGLRSHPVPLQDQMTVEEIRAREKMHFTQQAAEGKRNSREDPTNQDKIDRMFGVHSDDEMVRKRSLERHALALRNKLDLRGKSAKQIEKFIKSLGLSKSEEE